MDVFNNTLAITTQAFHIASEAYTFVYDHLKDSNIPLPSPNQVVSYLKTLMSFVIQHSPPFIQQWYGPFTRLLIESNFMNLFIGMFIIYLGWLFVKAAVLGAYRLIYNFVRACVTILALLLVLSAVNYVMMLTGYSSETTSGDTTRTYSHHT
ncbi:hypothetical protein CU098_010228 [Rhizopus stolonifer]|uniref:Uncharacterized protein n=1 Tax=Rhizopus stolonifer TaxID=4846 RepID=A0A367JEY0_RHIST|nr:hypothetical protein CU098_010228 [Rhizopus stolonifer]